MLSEFIAAEDIPSAGLVVYGTKKEIRIVKQSGNFVNRYIRGFSTCTAKKGDSVKIVTAGRAPAICIWSVAKCVP